MENGIGLWYWKKIENSNRIDEIKYLSLFFSQRLFKFYSLPSISNHSEAEQAIKK